MLRIICREMQKDSCRYVILAICAALTSGVFYSGKAETVSPESLVRQARKLQDVWSAGTPAVKIQTAIEIVDVKGQTVPGKYVVTWISPSRWREELEIASYKRVRVHNLKGYWQQSTRSVQPEIIFQLDSILDFKKVFRIGAQEDVGKVKSREKDGVRQKCAEVKWKTKTDRVLCFDDASGNLLSLEYPKSENSNPPDISRVVYSGFNTLGDKRIPYEVRAFRDRTVVLTAKVTEVTPITEGDSGPFSPPTSSEFWSQCEDVQSPDFVNRIQPEYPVNARANREYGRVVFYAVIEADGTVSHLTLIQHATSTLESAAAEAIRQWRYKPAACGGTPIRMETSIAVDFWIRH